MVAISLIIIIKHFNNSEESHIHTYCYHPGDLLPGTFLWG